MFDKSEISKLKSIVNQNTRQGDSLWERCFNALSKTPHSESKMEARKLLLQESPEARIRINTGRLKQIINYDSFKCHPQCSIARDEAVQGSDIDGAVVATSESTSLSLQRVFVQELRNQGFGASHFSEIQELTNYIDSLIQSGIPAQSKKIQDLIARLSTAKLSQIHFFTTAELEAKKSNEFSNIVMVYVAGYSI